MKEDEERFLQDFLAAAELREGLEELGPDAEERFRAIVVSECALLGGEEEDLARLDRTHALYEAFTHYASPKERLEALNEVCRLIEHGTIDSGALQPFIYMEDHITVLASAAGALVRLYESGGDEDQILAGARFLRQLVDESQDDIQRAGLLAGLVSVGDPRIGPLVDESWRLLGFRGQQRLAAAISGESSRLSLDFLRSWLAQAEGAEREVVGEALAQVQAAWANAQMGELSWRFEAAFAYATRLFGKEKRKGTNVPYLSHLLSVAALVMEAGGDEEQAIAALLHDAAEDCGGEPRLAEISRLFGLRVAVIVRACSDSLLPQGEEKEAWQKRKERHLRDLEAAHEEALIVVLADKLHNARSLLVDYRELGDALWQRCNAPPGGTLWYYREAARILSHRLPKAPLVHELSDTVARLEKVARRGSPE